MTNDEIIDLYSTGEIVDSDSWVESEVLKMLDAAREDEAIRFAEWIRENALYGNPGYWEVHPIDGIVLSLNSKKLYQYYKKQNP